MRQNPLCRSLRVDKVTLAGLEATLRLYRDPARAIREIPALRMLAVAPQELRERGRTSGRDFEGEGRQSSCDPGVLGCRGWDVPRGYPRNPCRRVDTHRQSVSSFARRLRRGEPPVLARAENDRLTLDPRTVEPEEEASLVDRVVQAGGSEID